VSLLQAETQTIKLKPTPQPSDVSLRKRFWPQYWDVYLHSVEYLELDYQRKWYWWQVRQTLSRVRPVYLGWPLCRIEFFLPSEYPDVCPGPVEDELANPDEISVKELAKPCPAKNAPEQEPLEELAKLAFPTNSEERERAAKRKAKAPARAVKHARRHAKHKAGKKAARRHGKRKTAKRSRKKAARRRR
jgi:hypothetical protein